ncbi:hypothetical protein pb186bvf_004531 [Paramecium bursaria]
MSGHLYIASQMVQDLIILNYATDLNQRFFQMEKFIKTFINNIYIYNFQHLESFDQNFKYIAIFNSGCHSFIVIIIMNQLEKFTLVSQRKIQNRQQNAQFLPSPNGLLMSKAKGMKLCLKFIPIVGQENIKQNKYYSFRIQFENPTPFNYIFSKKSILFSYDDRFYLVSIKSQKIKQTFLMRENIVGTQYISDKNQTYNHFDTNTNTLYIKIGNKIIKKYKAKTNYINIVTNTFTILITYRKNQQGRIKVKAINIRNMKIALTFIYQVEQQNDNSIIISDDSKFFYLYGAIYEGKKLIFTHIQSCFKLFHSNSSQFIYVPSCGNGKSVVLLNLSETCQKQDRIKEFEIDLKSILGIKFNCYNNSILIWSRTILQEYSLNKKDSNINILKVKQYQSYQELSQIKKIFINRQKLLQQQGQDSNNKPQNQMIQEMQYFMKERQLQWERIFEEDQQMIEEPISDQQFIDYKTLPIVDDVQKYYADLKKIQK